MIVDNPPPPINFRSKTDILLRVVFLVLVLLPIVLNEIRWR